MTSHSEEPDQTPEQMLLALKKDMNSLKDEENYLKAQLVLLNEQFQSLVKSAAEVYPEVLDEEFPKKAAARKQRNLSPYRPQLRSPDGATGKPSGATRGATRTPNYTRSSYRSQDSPHRRPALDSKRFPRRYTRMSSEEAAAKIQEQFENDTNAASGIDARKIRSSLPNSPTEETVLDPANAESSDDERRKKLKKKMIESRKVDVVHLGLF